ncbi:hypothetical protein GEMRC1_005336 [Eukaryota sp. GEM-RC1]
MCTSSHHTSLPANSLLAEQVRFLAPKLSSLSMNAVARYIQEVSHFLQAFEPSAFQNLHLAEPRKRDPTATTATTPQSVAERLAEVEIMIHAALREVRPEGFDPKTVAAYWSAAKEATISANPFEPTSSNPSSFYSSSTSVPAFLDDDSQRMKSKCSRSTPNTSQPFSSPHRFDDLDGPSFFDNTPFT